MAQQLVPLLAYVALTGTQLPQQPPSAPSQQATTGDAAARLLAAHNAERSRLGLPPLAWDPALAAHAQGWAETLARSHRFAHTPGGQLGDEGENLFMGTRGAYGPEAMVGYFLAERGDFRPGAFPAVARDGHWEHVGHYTQLVWRDTQRVGCAVASDRAEDYLVCRYYPPGNVEGEPVM